MPKHISLYVGLYNYYTVPGSKHNTTPLIQFAVA